MEKGNLLSAASEVITEPALCFSSFAELFHDLDFYL